MSSIRAILSKTLLAVQSGQSLTHLLLLHLDGSLIKII